MANTGTGTLEYRDRSSVCPRERFRGSVPGSRHMQPTADYVAYITYREVGVREYAPAECSCGPPFQSLGPRRAEWCVWNLSTRPTIPRSGVSSTVCGLASATRFVPAWCFPGVVEARVQTKIQESKSPDQKTAFFARLWWG